jgi:hypothetical protein
MRKLSVTIGLSSILFSTLFAQNALAQAKPTIKKLTVVQGVPFDQANALKRDLNLLKAMSFSTKTEEVSHSILGLTKISPDVLHDWLLDRVSYVVGEKFDVNKRLEVSTQKVLYPKIFERPDFLADYIVEDKEEATKRLFHLEELEQITAEEKTETKEDEEKDSGVMTVMSNLGAGIYNLGKPVLSPRVGIIQIGKGLFHPNLTITPDEPNNLANSINRLGTLFHEARHSDGNGKSLIFGHAICPSELKEYAGFAACDRNLNGPYSVGVATILEMTKNCKTRCSEAETEVLAMITLDSASRIIKDRSGSNAKKWDDSAEVAKIVK